MTKMTRSSCAIAILFCLATGNAIAQDNPEAQASQPDVTNTPKPEAANNQENQSTPKPKEEPASTNSSQGSATTAAEPECN